MLRNAMYRNKQYDPRIQYRGETASRLDSLTDAVFGIAITLLIFNLSNPNSFGDLWTFTKTLPAFLLSISYVILIWHEHVQFAEVYTLQDSRIIVLNTIFIALIIFFVYPLRFLTLFLTNFFFQADIAVSITYGQVPLLMIYFGFVVFALYFILYLLYHRAFQIRETLGLSAFEYFYTHAQKKRLLIMFIVPLISIGLTLAIRPFSFFWASFAGGMAYNLYPLLIVRWSKWYKQQAAGYEMPQ